MTSDATRLPQKSSRERRRAGSLARLGETWCRLLPPRYSLLQGVCREEVRGLIKGGSGAFGNTATRIEAFVAGGGTYVYGSYADIDGLFREQATDLDPRLEATRTASSSRCNHSTPPSVCRTR